MTSMLRYVSYVKRLNEVGRKVTLNQQALIAGRKFILQNDQNLFKSYATAAVQSKITIFSNNMKFQQFEDHVKRQGRISKSEVHDLINEIEQIGNVSSLDGLLLIRSCGRVLYESDSKESIKLVQEVWDTLENLQTPLDVSHFNALLNVYLEKEYDFTPDNFLKFMKEKGVEPNRVTYQRLIKRYCQKGDIAGATKMLEIMKEKGMPLNEDVFNSLILGHSEANDMESALKILNVMKTAGISPSSDTYTELICAYAKRGDLESILKTLSELSQNDITLLDSHYLEIFYTLVINGHEDKAENFLKEMPSEIHSDAEISRFINKLIFTNHIDSAIKLLSRTSKNLTRQKIRATSFVKAMIINKAPIEKAVQICRYFDEELQYNRAFQAALYQVLARDPKLELAAPLMKAWKEIGGEIREHYFWPLLVAEAKAGNMDVVTNILKSMIEDFEIMPTEETLKNYVLPYMFGSWENTISFFQPLNIPTKIIYNSIADRLLIERKLKLCATFVSSHPELYSKDVLLRHLVEALNTRDDVQSFVIILRNISETSEPADPDKTSTSLVDAALKEVMNVIPQYRSSIIIRLLEELVNAGLSISPEIATEIRNFVNNSLTDDVEETLQKLSSGSLNIVPMEIYFPKVADCSSPEKVINMRKIFDLRRNFAHHMEQNNIDEAFDIIQKLQAAGYDEVGIYAQAIRLFCDNDYLVGAESCIVFLKNRLPNAKLDLKKIIKYANLLIRNDRFNDSIEFLTRQRDANESEKNSKEIIRDVRYILESAANKKDVENLNKLFNLLLSKNYIIIDNFSLGPLVKIHTLRGDYPKALEVFEDACNTHKCTPYKNMLIKTFIESEDANSLQKITDLNSEIFGESNALVDLAFCFLEYGQPKQAQKIFETPGLRVLNEKVASVIEHYDKFNKTEVLNELIKVTKPVMRMDRSFLYDNILKLHQRKNDWSAGLALWTDMQEENIQPSAYFLDVLSTLLKENNQSTPFTFDSSQKSNKNERKDDAFYEAVKEKKYDYAEKLLHASATKQQSISQYNNLIMALLEHNELNRAHATANILMNRYGVIDRNVFNELSYKLIEARRYQDARELGRLLNDDVKKKINYWKVLNHADIVEKGLKNFIDNSKSSDTTAYNENQIHFGAITQGLLKNPEYVNEYEVWAKKMWDLGIRRAMHALWNYYFIINDKREEQIFEEYISGNRSILIKPITQTAIKNKDPTLIEKLIEKINKRPYIISNIRAGAYSDLIRVYLALNRPEDAFTVLRKYAKRYNIKEIPQKLLNQLQEKYERTGKKFPLIVETLDKAPIGSEYQNSEQEDKNLAQAEI